MISAVPRGRQCKPEFSTDKMVGNNKNLTARRRWSRTVSVPAECQISVGCVGSLCGSHRVCRNKATSTVVVLRTTPVSVTAVSSSSQRQETARFAMLARTSRIVLVEGVRSSELR